MRAILSADYCEGQRATGGTAVLQLSEGKLQLTVGEQRVVLCQGHRVNPREPHTSCLYWYVPPSFQTILVLY